MPTLYDLLTVKGKSPAIDRDALESLKETFERAVIIKADNVADYVHSQGGMRAFKWMDLPNAAPPFKTFWVEMRRPREAVVGKKLDHLPAQWGLLFNASEVSRLPANFSFAGDIRIKDLPEDTHWVMDCFMGAELKNNFIFPIFMVRLAILQDGTLAPVKTEFTEVQKEAHKEHGLDSEGVTMGFTPYFEFSQDQKEEEIIFTHIMYECVLPAMLTISFMHVRNVELVQREGDPKKRKRHLKKTGRSPSKYHVITINPIRKVIAGASSGNRSSAEFKKAMHIVRGHFKDYRHGPGLFGKWHGQVWVESHARGSQERGVSTHDYAVKAPDVAKYPLPTEVVSDQASDDSMRDLR